jgi:hypothetical protein
MSLRSSGLRCRYKSRLFVPAARSARVLPIIVALSIKRGRREHRMLAAPASLACKRECTLRTQATTGQPKQPAFPAQWVTAYTWSPRCTGLVSHRRLAKRPARLDPSVGTASGDRDRTISPSALRASSLRASRPSHPAARQVTIGRNAPLAGRDGRKIRMISASEKAKYFSGGA